MVLTSFVIDVLLKLSWLYIYSVNYTDPTETSKYCKGATTIDDMKQTDSWLCFPATNKRYESILVGIDFYVILVFSAVVSSIDLLCVMPQVPADVYPTMHNILLGQGLFCDMVSVLLVKTMTGITQENVNDKTNG